MHLNMASVAILLLLLMERFLASDMDSITEPVLKGLRVLEKNAIKLTKKIAPGAAQKTTRKLTRFYLFTPQSRTQGHELRLGDWAAFRYFNPGLDTKVIIHGFLDNSKIAGWMHHMKDEFLILGNFNVIIVDWSYGNSLPYTKAAANTERVGEEISEMLIVLRDAYGARPDHFHLIGHSLGSHVSGYVGEMFKGLNRITGLDPATYLFSNAPARSKLDRSDAEFVDVIHTDGGGIGMMEAIGHVDFYPNGGQIQTGCTASNSLRTLLEKGVLEGVRNMICSHMRAPMLFTETINAPSCHFVAYRCGNWQSYSDGTCDSCGPWGSDCATMGYHLDTSKDYGNYSKYYFLTANNAPYCGYEYTIGLQKDGDRNRRNWNESSVWPSTDILHVTLYGNSGNAEFQMEGRNGKWKPRHVVLSPSHLGEVRGAVIRWSKKPISRVRGVAEAISTVTQSSSNRPILSMIQVSCLKVNSQRRSQPPPAFDLCVSPALLGRQNQQGATFRKEYC